MKNTTYLAKGAILRASVASAVLGLALVSAPAFAQAADDEEAKKDEIVVTGSILRRTDLDTVSPVTTVTAESLDQRALNTVQESIQTLSANNGPALTNSFTANGAFGAGASAISLRGLSTSSTLVLFDGMRAAYYPLADDGARNFVDLNTIPDDIIDRVEVLRDGASSSYGADAIAGVVNIITKKQFQGLSARAEAGISQRGDAGNQRFSLTAGFGDLDEKGFNAYVSGFYYHSAQLKNAQRRYPYNSDDQRGICFNGVCGPNNVVNGVDENGDYPNLGFSVGASTLFVAPYNAANTTRLGRFQMLNPALGCNVGTQYNPTAAELAASNNGSLPTALCQEDVTKEWGVINPEITRYGVSGRLTYKLGDTTEAYLAVNYLQTQVGYDGIPATIRGNAPAGINFPRYSTSATSGVYGNSVLTLPVYVCAARVNCATAADKKLNPNNPFAAAGQVARLVGRLPGLVEYNQTRNRAYRAAFGVKGDLFDGWSYNADFTAMQVKLRRTSEGYVYIQHLLDVINDGTFNFLNPSANSQAVMDYLSPVNVTDSKSSQYQGQVIVSGTLAELPGGPLQLGVGGSVRRESVNAPSANDDYAGPTERYFRLNAFGTAGKRTVWSAFGELNAPIIDMVELNLSGRYDHYSSGQSSFSPKAGLKFKPIEQITLRGTWSKGFRIPSFAESNALPTTGFVNSTAGIFPAAYLAQYGCSVFTSCPTYIRNSSYGLTTIGTAGLKPEKSTNITLGAVFEPVSNIALTVDYYNIKKTNAITSANTSLAIAAYYAGQPIPAGYVVIPDAADINNPTALPRIAFVQSGFVNANTMRSEGLDFSATGKFNIGPVKWTTTAEASYILELSTTFPDGTKEQYQGTLGNFNLTAGTGTPRWHGSWQNTFDAGAFSITGTANYFGGYDMSAEDQNGPGTSGDCSLNSLNTPCRVKSYITFDVAASLEVNDKFTIYVNMLNAFDKFPPIDTATYGAHLYNAVQGGTGIVGRAFRAGVKVKF